MRMLNRWVFRVEKIKNNIISQRDGEWTTTHTALEICQTFKDWYEYEVIYLYKTWPVAVDYEVDPSIIFYDEHYKKNNTA